jgi:hypothetical protein
VLYEVVQTQLEPFLARRAEEEAWLPRFVEKELRGYLACGILAHGFARVRCDGCGDERLVAFSCKGRGVCPSCTTRRMHDTAAHLVDRVLPRVPLRQWTLSFPPRLRFALARDARLLGKALGIYVRAVAAWQRRAARPFTQAKAHCAALTFVQRFGSALQLTPHFHTLIPDGVFVAPVTAGDPATFLRLPPPTDEEVATLVAAVAHRVERLLGVRGSTSEGTQADVPTDPHARTLAAALPVPPGVRGPAPIRCPVSAPRTANVRGFSLHADRQVHENDRLALEHLLRYGLRPPIALDRLDRLPDGRVRYRMKRVFSDGTREVVLAPDAFLARLAALVPPPRVHLVRYHGVFAPASPLRAAVTRPPLATPLPHKIAPVTEDLPPPAPSSWISPPDVPIRPRRLPWADLLRRVHAIDVLACPCGARARVLAFITAPEVCGLILRHLGLPDRPPPITPARAPPHPDLFDDFPAFT